MLMLGLGDLNVLLEKIPIWKRLVGLPGEIERLEARVAELEAKLAAPQSKEACPSCGERAFFVESSRRALGPGRMAGRQDRVYKCRSCGFLERREETPG